jgi:Protein of unknown function (DUF433)
MNKGQTASRDPETAHGELVFAGTRVSAKTLVNYLEAGHTLDDFPAVSRVSYRFPAPDLGETLGQGACSSMRWSTAAPAPSKANAGSRPSDSKAGPGRRTASCSAC